MLLSPANRESKREASDLVRERNEKLVQEKRLKRTEEKKGPTTHKHSRTAAALAITDAGFTLCTGGVWSLIWDGPFKDQDLVRAVEAGRVRVMHCLDESTMARWNGAKTKQPLTVKLLPPFLETVCPFCKEQCHRWKAVAGICEKYHVPFDPIKH